MLGHPVVLEEDLVVVHHVLEADPLDLIIYFINTTYFSFVPNINDEYIVSKHRDNGSNSYFKIE